MTTNRFVFGSTVCFLLAFSLVFTRLSHCEGQSAPSKESAKSTSQAGHIWFIRTDGGDRTQCTGKADAPYKGSGSKQACAFNHPHHLFTNSEYGNKGWVVEGGDTIIIRGGPYRMGYKGPNPKDYWGNCPGDPFGCIMPPLPSGSSEHPTRLLGENYQNCGNKTQLFGGYGLGVIVNLAGSNHVDVECLDLTDHAQCTRLGGGAEPGEDCKSDYPVSDYAANGIATSAGTANVVLKNLDIHGFTSRGIIGAIGGDIYADHVRIAANVGAGWEFDDGRGTKSSANAFVHATYLTVEWNGCDEEYPITHAVPIHVCYDQDSGGYGDGIGTPDTPLNFACDHCTFRYNTQDGFDLLHVSGSLISITNSIAYGNMGQQWKMGTMQSLKFQNNVTVHNCRRMSAPMPGTPAGYNKRLGLFCRAVGDGIAISINDSGTYIFQNNSFAGYGATSYDIYCSGSCTKANIIFQNNLHVGYEDPSTNNLPGLFYTTGLPSNPFVARDHNIYYNMRRCPFSLSEHCFDPKIADLPKWSGEASLDGINFHLRSDSPARGAGVAIHGLDRDYDGNKRPENSPIDIGAFQFQK